MRLRLVLVQLQRVQGIQLSCGGGLCLRQVKTSRFHLAHESWRLGIVYSVTPPTVGDIQILSAYRAGHEARPHLV